MSDGQTWTAEVLDEFVQVTGLPIDRGVRARHFAASDWGGVVKGAPAGVLRPRSASEAALAVRLATQRGLKLTIRGTGASSGGQSIAEHWVTLDTTAINEVSVDPARRTVSCGPGATWRSLLFASLGHGLQPAVMPMQLDLTVGGVLSVGGFGAVGHRYGAVGARVTELEVVCGDGAALRCGPEQNADLFDAVRGGLGRCGVITGATLSLRPAPPSVQATKVRVPDAGSWVRQIMKLGRRFGDDPSSHVAHVEGFCRSEEGQLVYELHIGVEHGDEPAPDPWSAASDGGGRSQMMPREERTLVQYLARFDPRFDEMVASGHTGDGHPWIEALLSPEAFVDVLPDVMAGIAGDKGDRIQIVLVRRDLLPPLLVSPPADMLICLVVVPRGIPKAELPAAVDAMARVHQLVIDAGGKRYLAGWLHDPDEQAWRSHFGDRYDEWCAALQKYDPAGTFTSALFSRGQRR